MLSFLENMEIVNLQAWNSANVSGININEFCEMRDHFSHEESRVRITDEVKNATIKLLLKNMLLIMVLQ